MMRQTIKQTALACACLLCVACPAPWPTETVDNVHAVIERMQSDGAVTEEQATALRQVVAKAADGTTWQDVLEQLGTMLGSVVLALLGVQRMRGPAARLDAQSIASLRAMLAGKPDTQG